MRHDISLLTGIFVVSVGIAEKVFTVRGQSSRA